MTPDSGSLCLECHTALGHELVTGVLSADPDFGLLGFVHVTVCLPVWESRHVADRASFRLVEMA